MSKKIYLPESLSGILCFALGLYFLFSSELSTLKCKRLQLKQKVTCEVTYFGLLEKRTIPIPAGILQGAETHRKGKNNYGVILVTEIEKIPIESFSGTSKIIASKKAEKINNFINNQEQMSLEMQQYPNLFIVFLGIIFVIIPVLLLLFVLLNFIERKSSINRIQREISYPDNQDEKSDL